MLIGAAAYIEINCVSIKYMLSRIVEIPRDFKIISFVHSLCT